MDLIFATNNAHKVAEMEAVLPATIRVRSLKEAGILIEIPEPHPTLEANAVEKATVIYRLTGQNCFSEDTGLEVQALNGAPGVRSARYAGEVANAAMNITKLLNDLTGCDNRVARFRTIICLHFDEKHYLFEGICEGRIITERVGAGGFGYDPVFVPANSTETFAQMPRSEKNRFSHRRKALDKLVAFLNNMPLKP